MKAKENYRLTKQELILRYFAFSSRLNKYSGSLSKFLNGYMSDHRNDNQKILGPKVEKFKRVSDFIFEVIFVRKPPAKLSMTLLEAILVGVGKNIDYLENCDPSEIKKMIAKLSAVPSLGDVLVQEGTSKTQRVKDRLSAAITIFAGN